jgi:hypothetical protein
LTTLFKKQNLAANEVRRAKMARDFAGSAAKMFQNQTAAPGGLRKALAKVQQKSGVPVLMHGDQMIDTMH